MSIQSIIIIACVLILLAIFILTERKTRVHKKKVLPLPEDVQADEYVKIQVAIINSDSLRQLEPAKMLIRIYQNEYGNTVTGQLDVTALINIYELREKTLKSRLPVGVYSDHMR